MHRHRHLWTPWRSKRRRVAEVLAEARRRDEAEQRAAVERILTQPTTQLPILVPRTAPLLTRGQLERTSEQPRGGPS
jgi:hypothetical protein